MVCEAFLGKRLCITFLQTVLPGDLQFILYTCYVHVQQELSQIFTWPRASVVPVIQDHVYSINVTQAGSSL